MAAIKTHPWFVTNLPADGVDGDTSVGSELVGDQVSQTDEEILQIIAGAKIPGLGSELSIFLDDESLESDMDFDLDLDPDFDDDSS